MESFYVCYLKSEGIEGKIDTRVSICQGSPEAFVSKTDWDLVKSKKLSSLDETDKQVLFKLLSAQNPAVENLLCKLIREGADIVKRKAFTQKMTAIKKEELD